MSYTRYKGDPYWTRARYPSTCCRCGTEIGKGDRIFYYPRGKHVYCGAPDCGQAASADFEMAAQDEDFLAASY